jgi:PAS domain S-box-containing protein
VVNINALPIKGQSRACDPEQQAMNTSQSSQDTESLFIEDIGAFTYTLDREGNVISMSKSAMRFLGRDIEDILDDNYSAWFPKQELPLAMDIFKQTLHGKSSLIETVMMDKSGNRHDVECTSSPIMKDDKVVAVRGVLKDVTERKNMEDELQRTVSELQRYNDMATEREVQMMELKREVNELRHTLGLKEKYNFFASGDARNIVSG